MNVPKMTDINRRRIYVAGPMRGIHAFNFKKFDEAEINLLAKGWIVENPASISKQFGTPEQIDADPALLDSLMKEELNVVRSCDAIFLLSGWEKSAGAKGELAEAIKAGADVYLEDDRDTNLSAYIRYTLNDAEANLCVEKDKCDRYSGAAKIARERAERANLDLEELTTIITAAKEYVGGAK